MGVLSLYNLVFVSPQIMLFGIYILFRQQSTVLLHRINRSIALWSPKILRALLLGLGVLLILDSIGYGFGRSFIKL